MRTNITQPNVDGVSAIKNYSVFISWLSVHKHFYFISNIQQYFCTQP